MCIRDRGYPGDRPLAKANKNAQAEGWVLFNGDLTTTIGPCLLYTSDAADERSSVDLGGRRIIKKKTREDIVCIQTQKIKSKKVQE